MEEKIAHYIKIINSLLLKNESNNDIFDKLR